VSEIEDLSAALRAASSYQSLSTTESRLEGEVAYLQGLLLLSRLFSPSLRFQFTALCNSRSDHLDVLTELSQARLVMLHSERDGLQAT
jgi:hypothetical protein